MKTTTCYMCACRCGIRVHLRDGEIRYIDGNPAHPVNNGVICGLDVVVWPEVTTSTSLQSPVRLTEGRVVLPSRPSRPGVASMEVDTTLSVETNGAESLFHLRIGPRRAVEVVRVADNFYVEVDQQGGLAGFWLANVPPFTAFEEEM